MTTEYRIIRSHRRSIGLQVNRNAELVIRAPYFVSEKMIREVIREKQAWIDRTRARIQSVVQAHRTPRYEEGERFDYLGESYPLQIVDQSDERLRFENGFFLAREFVRWAPDIFEAWYRKRCLEFITPLVEAHACKLGVCVNQIKINGSRGRWGSCSANGNINFSWRLILTPAKVVDYVAAHEVAHLKERNHSSRFWKTVAFLFPDFEDAELWLKKEGGKLTLD